MDDTQVAVLGLGYVGCVTAACLAHLGNRVVGVDTDEFKVRSVLEGRAPFYEPGLEPLVMENVAAGRLSATTSLAGGLAEADVAMIAVGTPSERSGNLGLGQLRRVSNEIGQCLAGRSKPLVVAVRSTVFPGTCEEVVVPALAAPGVSVVSNPEFLREGGAVKDFLEPSLLVVGGSERAAVERVAALYAPLAVAPCLVSLRTAEMIKYACNSFHALKIAFANEVGALCDELDIPAVEVMDTLCRDVKLNCSPVYLKPGFAFGGSCLPKDVRALVYRATRLDLKTPLLESILPANEQHLKRAFQAVMDVEADPVGVFGLAFKENTDDLRESPVVTLIEQLIGKGRNLCVFDPHIRLDQIYGSNQRFLMTAIPHIGKLLTPTLDALLAAAKLVIVAQKPSAEDAARIQKSGLPVLDMVRAFPDLNRKPLAVAR